jgi:hypothetical protein
MVQVVPLVPAGLLSVRITTAFFLNPVRMTAVDFHVWDLSGCNPMWSRIILAGGEQLTGRPLSSVAVANYALRVASVSSIKCSPHVAGPWMYAGVHDRPVRRLLAWLLTLSAWEAGDPPSGGVSGTEMAVWGPFGGFPEGRGLWGLEQLITGQRPRRLRHEAVAYPADVPSVARC